jgi:glycosyltransferase involved in cell wall biosynthesis
MIDVIITAYHMHGSIGRAIASVLMQSIIDDVSITVVDDADERDYSYLPPLYAPLMGGRFRVLRKPQNTGCGQSRQYGIDRCEREYLTFLDADDVFASPRALEVLRSRAEATKADIVSSTFIEEVGPETYITHQNDRTWMHGKLYRTEFLRYHNIRFNDSRSNEDSAFNTMCYALCETQAHVDFGTYLWQNNAASLTRAGDWLGDTVPVFIGNAEYAVRELEKRRVGARKLDEIAYGYTVSIYGYYIMFRASGRSTDKLLAAARRFYRAASVRDRAARLSPQDRQSAFYNNAVITQIQASRIVMDVSLNEFLKIIGRTK